MATQANPAQPGAPATLRDTMAQADSAVDADPAIQDVQSAVNTTYLDDLSFSGDPRNATLGLGAKGSFDQLLERLELYLNPECRDNFIEVQRAGLLNGLGPGLNRGIGKNSQAGAGRNRRGRARDRLAHDRPQLLVLADSMNFFLLC